MTTAADARMSVAFEIPGSYPSVANLRESWSARARRAKRHRADAALLTRRYVGLAISADVLAHGGTVTLTRYAPRTMDTDNLATALKATRDGIAAALGVDDGDPRLRWLYAQERCRDGEQRVLVVVEAAARPESEQRA